MPTKPQTYTTRRLESLLTDLESDLAERKASWRGDAPDKGRQAVCAFANDLPGHGKPGVLFVGVTDDGRPGGLPITDRLLQTLSDIKTDGNILPPPSISVQKRRLKGKDVAVVLVEPADTPPVRYRGRIWVRVGPRRAVATAQDERILNEKRRHNDTGFETRPIAGADSGELNRLLFLERFLPNAFDIQVIANDGRTYEEQLAACSMVQSAENPVPTALGLIVIGKRPRHFIAGAFVQFLRFEGIRMSDPIVDEERIEGDLDQVVRRVDEKLVAHNRVSVDIVSQRLEQRRYLYPLPALQQLVRNAIMHRTYEHTNAPVHVYWFNDRIEIRSPGGPYGAVTAANFGMPGIVDYRNPRIADAMKVLGHVQRFGVGIQTAQEAMRNNGNPPVRFEVNQSFVVCLALPAPPAASPAHAPEGAKSALSRHQVEVLRNCRKSNELTKLMAVVGRADRTKFRNQVLNPLIRAGLVEMTIPDKPTSSKQRYKITEKVQKRLEDG